MEKNKELDTGAASGSFSSPPYAQPMYGGGGYPQLEETSLDIFAVFKAFYRGRLIFVAVVFAFAVAGAIYAKNQQRMFRANAVLVVSKQYATQRASGLNVGGRVGGLAALAGISIPSEADSDVEHALTVMQSSPLLDFLVKRYDLIPFLVDDYKEALAKDPEGTLRQAGNNLNSAIKIIQRNEAPNIYYLGVASKDPTWSAKLTKDLVDGLNYYMQQSKITKTAKDISSLNSQLSRTSLANIQSVIYGLIEEKSKDIALAQTQDDFVFGVIDPPAVPKEPFAPKRRLIFMVFVIVGALIAVPVVIGREVMKNGYQQFLRK